MPAAVYTCTGLGSGDVLPSPKSQAQVSIGPVESSANVTDKGASPLVADGVKAALGGGSPWKASTGAASNTRSGSREPSRTSSARAVEKRSMTSGDEIRRAGQLRRSSETGI